MNILVTAGSTRVMIDQVRCISNIFRGRTGRDIATFMAHRKHNVTLLTSEAISPLEETSYGFPFVALMSKGWLRYMRYRTYEELYSDMKDLIQNDPWDVIIHSAAVSDYKVEGTYTHENGSLELLDDSTKVSSDHEELYLRLVPTEKIVDRIRDSWGYSGKLVKFKLQVGMTDEKLCEVAESSRKHSGADIIVANCLEWSRDRAFLLSDAGQSEVTRAELPLRLLQHLSPCTD